MCRISAEILVRGLKSSCETQIMSRMQASVFGKRRILPEVSASGMESGKLGESGLSAGDHSAAVRDDLILAVLLSEFYFQMNYSDFSRPFHLQFL